MMTSHLTRVRTLGWVLPAVALLAVFVYFPLVANFGFSFLKWDIYSGSSRFIGFVNYAKLAQDPVFWTSLVNNISYALVSIVFQVFGALVLAAVIEGLPGDRAKRALRAIYFMPSAISLTVCGLLFYFIYEPNIGFLNAVLNGLGLHQLTGSWLGQPATAIWAIIVMSQWQGFGYAALLFAVAIQRIPAELQEAASIDGIGPVQRLFYITIPLVREMTALLMILTVSGAFQVFTEVMVMTAGGPDNASQVLGTWLYRSGFQLNDFGYAAAIATVIFVITFGLGLGQLWLTRRGRVEW